jgi:hypothetical protein
VTVAVSNYAIVINTIGDLVITRAGCVELLNHEKSTVIGIIN